MKINYLSIFIYLGSMLLFCTCASDSANMSSTGGGKGGSMARFAIQGNYLYTVDRTNLKIFDLSNTSEPELKGNVAIGWDIETIFPYGNQLFLGSETGMHIYDIQNPLEPQKLSIFQHIRSCDPVVVQGNYAYVTLRQSGSCGGGVNQLDVLDVSDLTSPQLIKSLSLQNPFGLGVDGQYLFVCDGDAGLKVFDINKPIDPIMIKQFAGINAYDVIPLNGLLLLIGKDGLYQYSYKAAQMNLVSKIPIMTQ